MAKRKEPVGIAHVWAGTDNTRAFTGDQVDDLLQENARMRAMLQTVLYIIGDEENWAKRLTNDIKAAMAPARKSAK